MNKLKLAGDSRWIPIIAIACILLKIFIIDIDPPKFTIANYQPLDEVYYVDLAMNLYKTGNLFNHDNPSVFALPVITNIFTYLSLLVFGNNYTGLRFSSILFAAISLLFFYLISKNITSNIFLLFSALLLLAVNYSFTLSNIIVEPTISRIASSQVSLYLIIQWIKKDKSTFLQIFILSTICTFLWLLTYFTNAFIILALFLAILFKKAESWRLRIKNILPFIIGVSISVLIYFALSVFINNSLKDTITRIGTNHGYRINFSAIQTAINFSNIFQANAFRSNPLLLFIFISGILFVFKNKYNFFLNNAGMFPWIFYSCFFLQTLFLNDFPQRKLVFLLPFIIFIIIQFFEFVIKNKKSLTLLEKILIITLHLIFLIIAIDQEKYFNISNNNFLIFLYTTGLFCLCYIIFNKTYKSAAIFAVIFILLSIESYNTYRFSLKDMTKYYKETFQYLNKLENKKFIGGFSKGFTLYNSNTAYFNVYSYGIRRNRYSDKLFIDKIEKMAVESKERDYMIGYEPDSVDIWNPRFEKLEVLMPAKKTVSNNPNRNVILYIEKENSEKLLK